MIQDFARELRTHLEDRRSSLVKQLISKPEERLAGRITELESLLRDLEEIKSKFLAKDEDDE